MTNHDIGFMHFDWNHSNYPFEFVSRKVSLPSQNYIMSNWHEPIEIKRFINGISSVKCNSSVYEFTAGDIVVINPYESHSVCFLTNPADYDYLLFSPQILLSDADMDDPIICALIEHRIRFKNYIHDDKELQDIFNSIENVFSKKTSISLLHTKVLIQELLYILLEKYIENIYERNEISYEIKYKNMITPAIEFIRQHYSETITIEKLATECGFSVSYFCSLFKNITGISAISFINKYRISQATVLLKNTSLSIEKIAEETGFADLSYFYRCYRQIQNQTPRQARFGSK